MAVSYKVKGNIGDPLVKIRLETSSSVQTFPLFLYGTQNDLYILSSNGLVFLLNTERITCIGYSHNDESRTILPLTKSLQIFCRRIGVEY